MAVIKAVHSKAKLSVAIDYVTRKEKTEDRLISGIHCDPMSATLEMENTKKIWHKTGGRQYDHYIQSFAPGEPVTPAQAHDIAVRWASGEFFGYECLVATHVDRDHIHSHIIVNSVNYQTGKKIHTSAHWLKEAKEFSDNLCREAGLSVCEKNKTFDGRERTDATTWSKDKHQLLEKAARGEGHSFILDIAVAVCSVLKSALSREDFIEKLLEYGIATTWTDKRKYITFSDLEGHKVRNQKLTDTFHYDFSKESLEHEFTKHRREQAQRESAAPTRSHRDETAADFHQPERPEPKPLSLAERLQQARKQVAEQNQRNRSTGQRGTEEYLSFDDLLSDGKRSAAEHNAGCTQSRPKRQREPEL